MESLDTAREPAPQKRLHRRVPRKWAFARTPADRAILLAGGTPADLACVLGCAVSTVENMRAPSRGGGDMPAHHREAFAIWAAGRGWTLPAGFLSEHRNFPDPREA